MTIVYADSVWRTAPQSNVVAFRPAEIQQTDLNELEGSTYDAVNELRKTFATQQDASRLTPAQLDTAIERAVSDLRQDRQPTGQLLFAVPRVDSGAAGDVLADPALAFRAASGTLQRLRRSE
jgi:hypothetical protein